MMRWLRLLALPLLAGVLLPAPAAAQEKTPGINLSWNQCAANAASAQDMVFACDDDAAAFIIMGSFVPPLAPDSIQQLTGEEAYIDLVSNSGSMPDWWRYETGLCRDGQLLCGTAKGGGQTGCTDYWSTAGAGGFIYRSPAPFPSYGPLPNTARLEQVFARPPATAGPVTAFREYYAFRIDITSSHTTGADPPTCSGCLTPVCLVFNELLLTQPVGFGDHSLTTASTPGKNMVTWQGAGANCALVPARRTSWGQVKSLYR
jgi:hypothetical protein